MLRQRVLSRLRSGPLVRRSSCRPFQSFAHGRNVSPFLTVPRLALQQLNKPPQSRILATSAPKLDISNGVKRSKLAKALIKTCAYTGFAGLAVTGLVVAFFVYDASTYKAEAERYDIGVAHLALNPRRGGPKNLPIAEILV